MPSVGVGGEGGEGFGVERGEGDAAPRLVVGGHHAVEPATVVAAVEVEVLFEHRGQRIRVFDDLAVHIDDPERAVGAVGAGDRSEPGVGGGEEFRAGFRGIAFGDRTVVGFAQVFAVDEVAADVTDEDLTGEGGQKIAGVDGQAAGGGEVAGGAAAALDDAGHDAGSAPVGADDAPWFFRAEAENLGGRAVDRDVDQRVGRAGEGIGGVRVFEGDPLEVAAVAADEAASGGVEGQTVLRGAGFGGEGERARVE